MSGEKGDTTAPFWVGLVGPGVEQDPDRLVPVDVLREMERAGIIGQLNNEFYSTTGNANPLENSRRMGREIAQKLKESQVDGVILTST